MSQSGCRFKRGKEGGGFSFSLSSSSSSYAMGGRILLFLENALTGRNEPLNRK